MVRDALKARLVEVQIAISKHLLEKLDGRMTDDLVESGMDKARQFQVALNLLDEFSAEDPQNSNSKVFVKAKVQIL